MTVMGMGMGLGMPWGGSGGGGSGASRLLGLETNGLAFAVSDDSMEIRDTVTPANNYIGSTIAKFGSVRASNALQTGSTGLIEWGPENLVLQSQTFDNAVWGKALCTVTANAIAAPDGTTTADALVETAASGQHRLSQTNMAVLPGMYFTLSVYAKANSRSELSLGMNNNALGNFVITYFNVASGTVGLSTNNLGTSWSDPSAAIVNVGLGWYRCSITAKFLLAATSINALLDMANGGTSSYLGDGTSNLYLWGAQFEKSTGARAYLPTTSSAVYGLRRDYDPRTGSVPLYLCEEARTNIILRSDELNLWTALGATVVADQAVGPDGNTILDKVYPTTTGTQMLRQNVSKAAASIQYTASGYFRAGGKNWLLLQGTNGGAQGIGRYFDISTGVLGNSRTFGAGFTLNDSKIDLISSGLYRVQMTFTTDAGGTVAVEIVPVDANNSLTGTTNGTDGVFGGGIQLEAGPNATSYIPTTSAAVTRAVDIPVIPKAQFRYVQATQTVYAKSMLSKQIINNGVRSVLCLGHQTVQGHDIYPAYWNTSLLPRVLSGNAVQAEWQIVGGATVLTYHKMAIASAANDMNAAVDGVLQTLDTVGGQPNPAGNECLMLGCIANGSAPLNSWVADGMYLPRRMSDAEITVLAT